MFSSKHLQQSIHLSNEALKELNKSNQDEAYIVDCYLSSLDYFIGALPDNLKLNDLPGSVYRQTLLRSKLESLINSQNDSSSSSSDIINDSNQLISQSTWKTYFIPKILIRQFNSNQNLIALNMQENKIEEIKELSETEDLSQNQEIRDHSSSSSTSQWNSKCKCGREISIKIPNCLIQETNPNEISTQSIHYWTNLILTMIISSLIWIKNSTFYQYIKLILFRMMNLIIFLEDQFKLIEKGFCLIGDLIEMMIKLDEEFGLWNRFIKGFVWMLELILRLFFSFTIQGIEGYQGSNGFRIANYNHQDQVQVHSHSHSSSRMASTSSSTSLDQFNQTMVSDNQVMNGKTEQRKVEVRTQYK
ncbi:uncharacterized protein MELLADRAFT_107096 [Melampsora larici-populina 98AG31]|uniref:Uncharacterized protein n=1 Tax=Melampsora larici-populina (strain 98AG31 / pathotype 3-4-7) TaxID=747676 RepID=F4RNN4_MELLP|nr:uncharacterized protein MELLADRAFT_107096 [Melampsora larici-populina 98AG31]EGG06015.1 hypothetical protein MELLADRAFT_107096 [Melampsora larici-populina 98AG31]